jgi:hypothetical protein
MGVLQQSVLYERVRVGADVVPHCTKEPRDPFEDPPYQVFKVSRQAFVFR